MTLHLALTPVLENKLEEQAKQHGLDAQEYALQLLEQSLILDTEDAWNADLDALTEGYESMPVLTPEATTRADIYEV